MKKWILIILLVIVVIAVVVIAYWKNANTYKYRVICDESSFSANHKNYRYKPGSNVKLVFDLIATDTNYNFYVEGVEDYDVSYSDAEGYVITFVMPEGDVIVDYTMNNSMTQDPSDTGLLFLSMSENPSTGFEWEYSLSEEDILVISGDWYESDPYVGPPVDGLGGTHYWTFSIEGEGIVELEFILRRGDEIADPIITYVYRCENGEAELIEQREDEYVYPDEEYDEEIDEEFDEWVDVESTDDGSTSEK